MNNLPRLISALLVCALCAAPAIAQDLPRIAVYVTGNVSEDEKTALGTRMLAALVNSGRYMGIERSAAFLAKVNEEHVTQRSGAIDDSQISELGKQFGVKYVCIAAITPAYGAFQVSARIIDFETAQVVFIGESNSPLKTIDDLAQVSDEVVMIMFGEAVARPRITKQKTGIGIGVGGLFSSDFGGGTGNIAMPYSGGGAYFYFDAKYGQLTIAYSTGGGKWDWANAETDMPRTLLSIGAFAKYPEIAIGNANTIVIYPLLGIDYEICIGSELITAGGITPPKDGELSALWGKIGGGIDYNINADVHIRAEIMYGARTANAYEGDGARLGHGVTVRAGAGVRF